MAEHPDETSTSVEPDRGGVQQRRLILIGLGILTAVVSWFVGAAVLPRWWAQRVGDAVDGRISLGAFLGVSAGVLFTVLGLLVLWLGFRFRSSWRRAVATLALAALVASPNLLTLGIVIGDGSAVHAGERILDVEGPGYRGGTLVGTVLGFLLAGAFAWVVASRRRNRRRVRDLRAQAASDE